MRIAPINDVYMDSINGIYSVVGAFFGKNDPENQEMGLCRVDFYYENVTKLKNIFQVGLAFWAKNPPFVNKNL